MPRRVGSIETIMRVIPSLVWAIEDHSVWLMQEPSLEALRREVEPHLDGQRLEHVAVLLEGERRDMFVGEESARTMPRNLMATEIYWSAARHAIANGVDPANYPEPWPAVCGPAVLFPGRQVWF